MRAKEAEIERLGSLLAGGGLPPVEALRKRDHEIARLGSLLVSGELILAWVDANGWNEPVDLFAQPDFG